jgi:hypothetical protein
MRIAAPAIQSVYIAYFPIDTCSLLGSNRTAQRGMPLMDTDILARYSQVSKCRIVARFASNPRRTCRPGVALLMMVPSIHTSTRTLVQMQTLSWRVDES